MRVDFSNKKILILLPSGIGDFIRDLGIINEIKTKYPKSNIFVVAHNFAINDLAKYNKNISKIINLNISSFSLINYIKYFILYFWKDILALNKVKPDILICITINPLRRILFRLVKAGRKIMINSKCSDVFEEYKVLDMLGAGNYSQQTFLNNMQPNTVNCKIKGYLRREKKNIVINMFCADSPNSIRDWDKWSELIKELSINNNIILIGKAEYDYKKHFKIEEKNFSDLINKTNIDELIHLIRNCDLVISVDSFIFHLAYAIKIPVVGLFGPVDPKDRIPISADREKTKTLFQNVYCSPCIKEKHLSRCYNKKNQFLCMKSIEVSSVLKLADELLNKQNKS